MLLKRDKWDENWIKVQNKQARSSIKILNLRYVEFDRLICRKLQSYCNNVKHTLHFFKEKFLFVHLYIFFTENRTETDECKLTLLRKRQLCFTPILICYSCDLGSVFANLSLSLFLKMIGTTKSNLSQCQS